MNPAPVSSSKYSTLTFFLFFIISIVSVRSETNYTFSYSNQPLRDVLIQLIQNENLSIVFSDQSVDSLMVTAQCQACTDEQSINLLLENTPLIWEKSNNQFIIYEPPYYQFSIFGNVKDASSGESIPFANVFIQNKYVGDVTNKDGRFTLVNIPVKQCTLQVSYIGYQSTQFPLSLPLDGSQPINVSLKPKVILGENVVIKGDYLEFMEQSSGHGQIAFSPRHIASLPNLGETDIFRSLQLLPGIQMGNAGTSELFVRGGTPDQNQIFIDGIPIYKPNHFFGFFSSINSHSIKDIQVYKGHIPIQYGGRLSSVLSLTGKSGHTHKKKLSLFMNILSSGISYEQPLPWNGSWIFSTRQSNSKYFESSLYQSIQDFVTGDDRFNLMSEVTLDDPSKTTTYNPQFNFIDINNKLSFLLSPTDRVSLTFIYGSDDIQESRSFVGFPEIWTYDSVMTQENTMWINDGIGIQWTHFWSPYFESEFHVSQSRYKSLFEIRQTPLEGSSPSFIQVSKENNEMIDHTLTMNHHWVIHKSHQLDFGVQNHFYDTHLYTQNQNNDNYTDIIDQSNSTAISTSYINDEWSITPNTNATFGIRMNSNYVNDSRIIEPRISLQSYIAPTLRIEGFVGKNIQYLHQFKSDISTRGSESLWTILDENLQPSQSINMSLGLHWFSKMYQIQLDIYRKYLSNIYQYYQMHSPASPFTSHRNIIQSGLYQGDGVHSGIELLLQKKQGIVQGWIAYHFGQSSYTFSDLYGGQTYQPDHDRTHELKAVAIGKLQSWDITLNWVYSSGSVYTDLEHISVSDDRIVFISDNKKNIYRLPPIHRLDLSVTKSSMLAGVPLETGISIFNVYNQKNISYKRVNPFGDVPTITDVKMLGFSPTVFLKVNF